MPQRMLSAHKEMWGITQLTFRTTLPALICKNQNPVRRNTVTRFLKVCETVKTQLPCGNRILLKLC